MLHSSLERGTFLSAPHFLSPPPHQARNRTPHVRLAKQCKEIFSSRWPSRIKTWWKCIKCVKRGYCNSLSPELGEGGGGITSSVSPRAAVQEAGFRSQNARARIWGHVIGVGICRSVLKRTPRDVAGLTHCNESKTLKEASDRLYWGSCPFNATYLWHMCWWLRIRH